MAYSISVKVKVNGEIKTVSVKKEYRSKEAATKAGERLLAEVRGAGMVPIGSYTLRNTSGKEVRPFMDKDSYDDLYHFISPGTRERYTKNNKVPVLSKRYDTLDQARRGALAKSKQMWESNEFFGRKQNISLEVYKGQEYLGFVTYNFLKKTNPAFKGYEGTWTPAGRNDEQMLKKDGTLV